MGNQGWTGFNRKILSTQKQEYDQSYHFKSQNPSGTNAVGHQVKFLKNLDILVDDRLSWSAFNTLSTGCFGTQLFVLLTGLKINLLNNSHDNV